MHVIIRFRALINRLGIGLSAKSNNERALILYQFHTRGHSSAGAIAVSLRSRQLRESNRNPV